MRTLIWLLLLLVPAAAQQPLVPGTTARVAISAVIVSTPTLVITGRAGASIYLTGIVLVPAAGSVVTFSSGISGTNCGTSGPIVGAMTFPGNIPFVVGSGYGAVLVVPQGQDLCLTIATAVAPGWLSYGIF
jgi:hypothetical protein